MSMPFSPTKTLLLYELILMSHQQQYSFIAYETLHFKETDLYCGLIETVLLTSITCSFALILNVGIAEDEFGIRANVWQGGEITGLSSDLTPALGPALGFLRDERHGNESSLGAVEQACSPERFLGSSENCFKAPDIFHPRAHSAQAR